MTGEGNPTAAFGFDPASVFDPVAAGYAANRPGYPDALYDAVAKVIGRLDGRRVLDVGAGTGISARAMAARGARVVAVDPSLAMLRTLRRASEPVPATLGRAERLAVADGSVDIVTFAQAWHWVRLPDAALECRRVLAGGGALALWWNVSEDADELYDTLGINRYGGRYRQDDDHSLRTVGGFGRVVRDSLRWEWRVPLQHWLQTIETRSEIAKLGAAAPDRMGAIAEAARRFFPDGTVSEWFTTRVTVAFA